MIATLEEKNDKAFLFSLVEESHRIFIWHEAPRLPERLQIDHLVLINDVRVQIVRVVKLRNLT